MSEPEKKARGKRRPALMAALKAAKEAGLTVKGAVIEEDRVVLTFGDGTTVGTNNENEWSRRLKDLGYGKN
jgi:hypothetical protein